MNLMVQRQQGGGLGGRGFCFSGRPSLRKTETGQRNPAFPERRSQGKAHRHKLCCGHSPRAARQGEEERQAAGSWVRNSFPRKQPIISPVGALASPADR